VCLGPHSTIGNSTVLVGRRYGCSPATLGEHPVVCQGHRFSCPDGTTCEGMKDAAKLGGGFTCKGKGDATNATLNGRSTVTAKFAPLLAARSNSGLCEIIGDDLPSECTCKDDVVLGGTIDCTEDLAIDTVGLRGVMTPCGDEAKIALTIYETDIGFQYSKSISSGVSIASFPIPGLSVGIPVIGDAGVYAGIEFKGSLQSLTLEGDLDLCADTIIGNECGSKIYSGLPVDVIDGTWDFTDICGGGGKDDDTPSKKDDDDQTDDDVPSCNACINNDQVWCWDDFTCYNVGSSSDTCSDADCVSSSSFSSCDTSDCSASWRKRSSNATATKQKKKQNVVHVQPTVAMSGNAATHYGDPLAGPCMSDEQNITITGVAGSVCSPAATGILKKKCPTDTPAGCTIVPAAILQDQSGDQYCALECSPALPIKDQKLADSICGADNMSCKPISGLGICTYDA
jgi:hypothetical protein